MTEAARQLEAERLLAIRAREEEQFLDELLEVLDDLRERVLLHRRGLRECWEEATHDERD